MPWWDRDSGEFFTKKPRCSICVSRSVLIQNGNGTDLKCPSCKAQYDKAGNKIDHETDQERAQRLLEETRQLILDEEKENWTHIWGGNGP